MVSGIRRTGAGKPFYIWADASIAKVPLQLSCPRQVFARDPRIGWTDTLSVGFDGYMYFTEHQLWRVPMFYPGVDRRVKPYVLYRAKLPGNGTKVVLS